MGKDKKKENPTDLEKDVQPINQDIKINYLDKSSRQALEINNELDEILDSISNVQIHINKDLEEINFLDRDIDNVLESLQR